MNWDKIISQSIDKAERTSSAEHSIRYVQVAALCSIAKSLDNDKFADMAKGAVPAIEKERKL